MRAEAGAFDVLLYHHDGSPAAKCAGKLSEVRRELREAAQAFVPVVPVRETEAWVLADQVALARTLSLRETAVRGVPGNARAVEALPDPKKVLSSLLEQRPGSRRRQKSNSRGMEPYFFRFAETADLDRLLEVPSFAQWWTDMTGALEAQGYFRC